MLKKITLVTMLACMLLCTSIGRAQEEIEITAQSAILMDKDSGRVLFERHAHVKRPMASTTKIMTAILALEMGNLEDVVTVSPLAAVVEGSSIWLEAGEKKTLEELVYGLMLRSGNDAAYAIAEHIGGTVENFALMMTQKARQLGAYNTRFQNPHGLHDDNHYSTAYDMAVLARHALGIHKFREIIATEEIKISWPGHEWARILRNQNRLLELYPGGDGIKTGWTTPAGRCFVGSATRDGWQLISVVLNASSMWEDAMLMLDYGYQHYGHHSLVRQHAYIRQVPLLEGVRDSLKVVVADSFSLALKPEEEKAITYTFNIEEGLQAPVKKGQVVGNLEISQQGQRLGVVLLLAGEDVERASFFFRANQFIRRLFSRS